MEAKKPKPSEIKRATARVMTNLQKDNPSQGTLHEPVGYSLDLSSLEEFTRDAKAWLGDKSELGTRTLEIADYSEGLEHFRHMTEWKPREKPVEAPKPSVKVTYTEAYKLALEMVRGDSSRLEVISEHEVIIHN